VGLSVNGGGSWWRLQDWIYLALTSQAGPCCNVLLHATLQAQASRRAARRRQQQRAGALAAAAAAAGLLGAAHSPIIPPTLRSVAQLTSFSTLFCGTWIMLQGTCGLFASAWLRCIVNILQTSIRPSSVMPASWEKRPGGALQCSCMGSCAWQRAHCCHTP
jgi:hypothetical protein